MRVNCSTSCDGIPTLGLETPLTKKEVAQGTHWKVFDLSDVQEDSRPLCFANCPKQTMAAMSLTVYCEWLGPGAGTRQAGRGRWAHGAPGGLGQPWLLAGGARADLLEDWWAPLQRASLSFETPS